MGLPETPSQCLCPLGQGSGDGSRVENHHNRIAFSSTTARIEQPTVQHPSRPPALLRRSTPSGFYDGEDARQCIDECLQGFQQSLLPSSLAASSQTSLLTNICSRLTQTTAAQQSLWQLYWCDSVFCGVWIDDNGIQGQDPNVDLIINECQSLGYSSIYDPGPPPHDFYCSSLLAAQPSANPCRNQAAVETKTVLLTALSTNTIPLGSQLLTLHHSEQLTTAPAPQNTGHSFLINGNIGPAVATADATIPSSSNRLIKETAAAGAGSRVSAGVEAAIFACIITVVLLIAGVVFFCIRQRRKNMAGQALHPPSHAEAKLPTPLISPANSCRSARTGTLSTGGASSKSASPQKQGLSFHTSRPSTCSPSDDCTAPSKPSWLRRFFSFFFFFSFRSRDRSASPPLTSLSPPPSPTQMSARARHNIDPDLESNGGSGLAGNKENRVSAATSGSSYYGYYGYNGHYVPYYFPSSPICAPTTNKLEPRRERTPTIRPSKQQDGQKQEQPASPVQQNTDCRTLTSSQTTVDSGSPVPPVPPLPALPISLVSTQSSALGIRESNVSHHNPRLGHASRSATLNGSSVLPSSTLYGNAVTTDAAEPMARLSSRTPVPATVTAGPVRPKRPRELSLDMSSLSMPYPTVPFKAPVVYRRPGKSNTLVLEAANMHSSFAVMQAPPPARNLPKPMFPQAPPLSRTKVIARGEAEARTRNSASSFNPIPLLMRDEDDDHSGCGERGAVDRTRSISSRSSASTNDSGRFAVPGRTLSISRPSQAHYQGSYSVVPRIQTVRPTATANPNDSKRHAGFI